MGQAQRQAKTHKTHILRNYKVTSINLEPRTLQRVKNLAAVAGSSRSAVIQIALDEFFGSYGDARLKRSLIARGACLRRRADALLRR